MKTIIEIAPLENGAHRSQTWTGNNIPEGYAIIPDDMEKPDTFPFVNIEVEDGIVTAMTAGEVPVYPDDHSDEIAALKAQLAAEDYKVIKCFEAQMCGEELPYDIAELHATRNAIRAQINELQGGDA